MKYLVCGLVAVAVMGSAVMAKDAAVDGAKVEKAAKAEKANAMPSFKGKLAVVKDGDNVTSVTLTVKDTTYQISLDDKGLKLAGEAADKDVSVQGTLATVPGADGKEVKTITVAKFKVVQPKAAGEGEGKKKAQQQQ